MSEFSKTLAMLGLLAPLGAGAMGIGDIHSNSALNQVLNAEIPLVLSGNDRLDTIQVRLASPDAFDKAGVERLHALTQLSFKTVAKPDGRYVIQVSSREVIQEPFLDFLVEVESPQGTLLREFTLLLDPPRGITQAYTDRDSGVYAQTPRYEPGYRQPAPTRPETYTPDSPPAADAHSDRRSFEPSSRPTRNQLTDRTYGPVRRGERLMAIAAGLDRPPSVTARQMAEALYLANPHAFSGNMNGLRAGSRLRIPTDDFITQLDSGYDTAVDSSIAERSPPPHYRPSLEATPPADSAAGGAVADVSSRVPSALKRENEELRERLTQLEQRLEEAQRMLQLKNAELATLHTHHAEQAAAADEQPARSTTATPAANPSMAPPEAAATVPAPVPMAPPVQAAVPKAQVAAPTLPPPATIPKPAEIPPEEYALAPGYWLASGGLTLLGLGAWLYHRRRSRFDKNPADDLLVAAPPNSPAVTPPEAAPQDPLVHPIGFTESAFSPIAPALETSALDPLWEADVYLRYGRYPQAESLIREAIKQAPEQNDLKLKLFEIFHSANNQDAYLGYALELHAQRAELPVDFWTTVQTMRPEWLPPAIASELESAAVANPPPVESASNSPTEVEETVAMDLEDTDFTAELRALEAQYAGTQTPVLDAQDKAQDVPVEPQEEDPLADAMSALKDLSDESLLAIERHTSDAELDAMLDDGDTDFTEELRALEAQFGEEQALPDPNGAPILVIPATSATGLLVEQSDVDQEPDEIDNLVEFVAPVVEELKAPQPTPTAELELENLIAFEPGLGSAHGLGPAPATLCPPVVTGDASAHELVPAPATRRPTPTPPTLELSNSKLPELVFGTDSIPGTRRDESFGKLDFELDLFDPGHAAAVATIKPPPSAEDKTVDARTGADDASGAHLLELARTAAAMGDKASAREALQSVLRIGKSEEKAEAEKLLNELVKVRLSLVPPVPRTEPESVATPPLPKMKPGI